MSKKLLVLLMVFSSYAMAASKPTVTAPMAPRGGAIAIPDDAYDGTIVTMACITVAGPGGDILDMNVDLDLEHTWAGDLVIKVVAPDTTVLTLQSRAGYAEVADDGTGGFGDSSDYQAGNVINFINGGATSAEDAGSTIAGGDFICATDGLCSYSPAPDQGPGTDFTDFVGMDSTGNWQVCIGDAGAGDTGNFISAAINFDVAAVLAPPTPVPSLSFYGILLMISLLIGMLFYRQKRKI
jgi:subtilisin-like proprotein convertase family protein